MKNVTLVLVLLFAISAFAFADVGNTSLGFTTPTIDSAEHDRADWDITVTSTNSFTCGYAQYILGMDYHLVNELLIFNSAADNATWTCDPDTGAEGDKLDHPWGISSAFGVVMTSDSPYTLYLSDWTESVLHSYINGSWATETNPVGNDGRGMDFDGTDLWITDGSTGVCRFQPGTGESFYIMDEPQDQLTGLTTFPFGSNVGLMVTCYGDHNFYFYEFDGSSLLYLGTAPIPSSCRFSMGLAYSETRDSYFWSSTDYSGAYHIEELDITFTETSIEETTWGQIKSQF